jgi:hypothetical protein
LFSRAHACYADHRRSWRSIGPRSSSRPRGRKLRAASSRVPPFPCVSESQRAAAPNARRGPDRPTCSSTWRVSSGSRIAHGGCRVRERGASDSPVLSPFAVITRRRGVLRPLIARVGQIDEMRRAKPERLQGVWGLAALALGGGRLRKAVGDRMAHVPDRRRTESCQGRLPGTASLSTCTEIGSHALSGF